MKQATANSWADRPLTVAYTGQNIGTTQTRTYASYDAVGRIGSIALAATDNPTRYHTYDTGGRLSSYEDWKDNVQIIGWDFTWDELHQEWDSTAVWGAGLVGSGAYTYDKIANRTDHSASLDSANRLLAFDGWTITYDDAGYMTKRKKGADSLVYTWNALGQLMQVTAPGYTTKYGYDAFGNRIRKSVNTDTTRYVVEDGQVIVELNNAWQVAAKYTYYPGVDRPQAMVRAGKRYYYLQDGQGNVVAVIDSVGTIKNTYAYTPYGEALTGTSETVANPFRYKGREWDAEARLYFNRARYYDPLLGRFISDDPIGLAGGANPTAFVTSEPVNRSDPSGQFCQLVGWNWEDTEVGRVYTPRYGGTTCDSNGSGGGSPFERPGSSWLTGSTPWGDSELLSARAGVGVDGPGQDPKHIGTSSKHGPNYPYRIGAHAVFHATPNDGWKGCPTPIEVDGMGGHGAELWTMRTAGREQTKRERGIFGTWQTYTGTYQASGLGWDYKFHATGRINCDTGIGFFISGHAFR